MIEHRQAEADLAVAPAEAADDHGLPSQSAKDAPSGRVMTYAAQKLKTGSSRTASTRWPDGDDDGEEHHRFEVAQMQRRGREVTERGASAKVATTAAQ